MMVVRVSAEKDLSRLQKPLVPLRRLLQRSVAVIAFFFLFVALLTSAYISFSSSERQEARNDESVHKTLAELLRPALGISDYMEIQRLLGLVTKSNVVFGLITRQGDVLLSDYVNRDLFSQLFKNGGFDGCPQSVASRILIRGEHWKLYCTDLRATGSNAAMNPAGIGALISLRVAPSLLPSLEDFMKLTLLLLFALVVSMFYIRTVIAGQILGPLETLVSSVRVRMNSVTELGHEPLAPLIRAPSEIDELRGSFNALLLSLRNYYQERHEFAKNFALANMAAEVAHNIRSPLAVLHEIENDLHLLPADTRAHLREAVSRIQSIANNLLANSGMQPKVETEPSSVQSLPSLVGAVIAQKKLELRAQPFVELNWCNSSDRDEPLGNIQATAFKCVLSNLINNAVHASGDRGLIEILLSEGAEQNQIVVRDHGTGISKDILPRLMQRGETHGKDGGRGIGLFHAKSCAEAWGGELTIQSEVGRGTVVTLALPRWSGKDITTDSTAAPEAVLYDAVLIDDDPLIHWTWKDSAKKYKKLIRTFETVADFLVAAPEISHKSVIYVDSQLKDGILGEHASKEIYECGFKKIYLATGREKGDFDLGKFPWLQAVLPKNAPWEA